VMRSKGLSEDASMRPIVPSDDRAGAHHALRCRRLARIPPGDDASPWLQLRPQLP
jgi:hypothetical protein